MVEKMTETEMKEKMNKILSSIKKEKTESKVLSKIYELKALSKTDINLFRRTFINEKILDKKTSNRLLAIVLKNQFKISPKKENYDVKWWSPLWEEKNKRI